MVTFGIFLIRTYQVLISPLLPRTCRFYPTCSQYAIEALHTYGFFYGISLILYRIGRCHPWCEGGYDPLPQSKNIRKK